MTYLPQLDRLRGIAACGILVTHCAFQTGVERHAPWLARFDLFVAVFFALSAYLLYRAPSSDRPSLRRYYARRARRILPGYVLCVLTVFAFLPAAFGHSWRTVLKTLTFTQIYFPFELVGGLTHLWSLSVEVAFYLFLPALFPLRRAPKRTRALVFAALAVLGFAWAALPFPTGDVPNFQLYPISYLPWFCVGLFATLFDAPPRIHPAIAWPSALLVCWVAAQPWFAAVGLEHPTPAQFVRKILAGTVFAALLLFGTRSSSSSLAPVSYSIFLWHLPVLSLVFAYTGIPLFSGSWVHFVVITLMTFAVTYAVGWVMVWMGVDKHTHGRNTQYGGQPEIARVGAGPRVAS